MCDTGQSNSPSMIFIASSLGKGGTLSCNSARA
jgi:hypothetical protein